MSTSTIHSQKDSLGSFHSFSAKASIEFVDHDDVQNFNATIRYQKNDSLWMSFTGFMGIEGARMMIHADSTFVDNRLEKTHLKFPNNQANDLIPFGFELKEWETLLIHAPNFNVKDSNIEVSNESNQTTYTIYQANKISKLQFDQKKRLTKYIITQTIQNTVCEINFNQFKYCNNLQKDIAYERTISIKSDVNEIKIKINYDQIHFDKPLSMPFIYSTNP